MFSSAATRAHPALRAPRFLEGSFGSPASAYRFRKPHRVLPAKTYESLLACLGSPLASGVAHRAGVCNRHA